MEEHSDARRPNRRRFIGAGGSVILAAAIATASSPFAFADAAATLDAGRTALLLIDFQSSNASLSFKPHPFNSVADNAAKLATALRSHGGLVVHTRVLVTDMLDLPADDPLPSGSPKADGDAFVLPLQPRSGDVVVTKRQWGSFYGTDLEQQLRRHDIRWLMIAGVATEVGVESTAREAYDRGYPLVFVEDAISGATDGTHEMFLEKLFPRMGLVRSAGDAIGMLRS